MKSKIRVELDMDNSPILEITVRGNKYNSNQDLADKVLAQLFHDTIYFELNCTGGGEDNINGGYTDYVLRPVKKEQLYTPLEEEINSNYIPLHYFTGEGIYKGLFLNHPLKKDTLLNLKNIC